MPKFTDLTGNKYGRLSVTKKVDGGNKCVLWECICDCGNRAIVRSSSMTSGRTRSCGCLARESSAQNGRDNVGKKKDRHGHARRNTSTYGIWRGMKQRCLNKLAGEYPNYGGRGIKVCDRWLKFDNFLADMGVRPAGHHLDRLDNNGHYEPNNCAWVTPKQNQRHTRKSRMITAFGETKCLSAWAESKGIKPLTLHKRLVCGWDVELALTKPVEKRTYESANSVSDCR